MAKRLLLTGALLFVLASSVFAQNVKLRGNIINGHSNYAGTRDWNTYGIGMWEFTDAKETYTNYEQIAQKSTLYGNQGAIYVDGYYYTFYGREKQSEDDPYNFDTDMNNTEEEVVVRKWDASNWTMLEEKIYTPNSNLNFCDLTYDANDDKVYCIYSDISGTGEDALQDYYFGSLDLATMTVTRISKRALSTEFRALAAHPNGKIYAIGYASTPYDGKLCTFDKKTGEFTDVGDVGHGIQRTMQSAVCDWRTGKMYWVGPMNDGKDHSREGNRYGTALYEVNVETGESTLLSRLPYKENVVGLYVVGDIVKKANDVNIKLGTPSQLNANELATAVATVKNLGTNVAKGYTVKLFANGQVRATIDNGMDLQPGESVDLDLDFVVNVSDGTKLSLYATVELANDENESNNVTSAIDVVVVQSILPTVSLMGTEENGMVKLAWDAPNTDAQNLTEDFERYAPFIINHIGDWTCVKRGEAQATVTMRDFEGTYIYPNVGKPFAYQVFNPSEAGIYIDNYATDTCTYYCQSGKQMLIALAGAVPADNSSGFNWAKADNWLISPELSGKAQTIAFYAKCWTSQVKQYASSSSYTHYDEKFHVLYSTTDKNPENFTRLNADTIVAKQRFKEGAFQFELPEGAKYFAIQHVTDGETGFCFFLDDISFQPVIAHLKGFNVYCNGVKVNEELLSANTTEFTTAIQGVEVNSFSVSAVYEEGESMASNAFNVIPAAITNLQNDKLHKTGIYTLNGQYIGTQLPAVRGLYVVRLSDGQTQKVIVK